MDSILTGPNTEFRDSSFSLFLLFLLMFVNNRSARLMLGNRSASGWIFSKISGVATRLLRHKGARNGGLNPPLPGETHDGGPAIAEQRQVV